MNRNRCPRISIRLTFARSCTPATHHIPVHCSFSRYQHVTAVVVASSLGNTAPNASQSAAPPAAAEVSLDMDPLPGNPCLHTLTDLLMAFKRALTQVCADAFPPPPPLASPFSFLKHLRLQHHFSMILVATGLVFIIAGGSVRTNRPNSSPSRRVRPHAVTRFAQVRARPLDPATDKDTTLGIALGVLGAYL